MLSLFILAGIILFVALVVGGLIWAAKEDARDDGKKP